MNVGKHEAGGETFRPFDWFVAVVYLLFNGSTVRAVDFLNRLQGTSLVHYLWAPGVSLVSLIGCFVVFLFIAGVWLLKCNLAVGSQHF